MDFADPGKARRVMPAMLAVKTIEIEPLWRAYRGGRRASRNQKRAKTAAAGA